MKKLRERTTKVSILAAVAILLLVSYTFSASMILVFSNSSYIASPQLKMEDIPSKPVKVELSLPNAPPLGAEAQLVCSVTSKFDTPNTEVRVELPKGFTLVKGEIFWFGDIAADNAIEIKSVIKSVQEGAWTIQAYARSNECSLYRDMDEIHVFVFADSAFTGESPYPPMCERVENPPTVISSLSDQGIVPEAPQPDQPNGPGIGATLTVTGRFWCYISQDSLSGHTSDTLQPMCWGWVKIYNTLGLYLGGDITGPKTGLDAGYFSIPISNPWPLGLYVEMLPWSSACHVVKPDGSDYNAYTPNFYPSSSQTQLDVGAWRTPDLWDYWGAWRIYESISQDNFDRGAWDFMVNEGPGFMPPEIKVYFKMPDGHGTHIHLGTGEIDIDTEAYSKALDIAQHEYGHWVMYKAYSNWWPPGAGGAHSINRISSEPTAWTEGFADIFPLICQSYNPSNPYSPRHMSGDGLLDSCFEWGQGSQYDLETCPGCDPGTSCEGRIAGTLWDIYEDHNDGYDTFAGDSFVGHIWYTVSHGTQAKYLDFHNQWRSYGFNRHLLNFCEYQNTIDYDTSPDLTNGYVDPISGYTTTAFTFWVKYQDVDWDPAAPIGVYVYDGGWNYYTLNHYSGDPASGEWFNKQLSGFSAGDHSFYFTAFDGLPGGDTRYPALGYLSFHVEQIKYTITFYTDPSTVGSITFAGTTYIHGQSGQYATGSYSVGANVPSGWTFDHWETTGVVSISGSTATVTGAGTIKAVFKQMYNVTVTAHCNIEGVNVGVAITMDGSPTGYNTPHTFSVAGTHTFGVPATDANGHQFSQWNIGEATTTITVASAGTYVAYYGPSFTIWTEGYKTTYKIGETMKVYVRVRNPGPALPVRAEIFLKLPSNALYGPLLDMKVTLPANYDSGKVLWKTFTIPSAPLGTYGWIAELRNPTTNALISQSTWNWQLLTTAPMQVPTVNVILQAKPE